MPFYELLIPSLSRSHSLCCFCFMSAASNCFWLPFTSVSTISMSGLVFYVCVCVKERQRKTEINLSHTCSSKHLFRLYSFTLHEAPSLSSSIPLSPPFLFFLPLVFPFKVLKMTNFAYLLNYSAPRLWACVSVCHEKGGGGRVRRGEWP